MAHIVSFRMSDDELRERLGAKDDEVLYGGPGIYSLSDESDESDGSQEWVIEATLRKEGGE